MPTCDMLGDTTVSAGAFSIAMNCVKLAAWCVLVRPLDHAVAVRHGVRRRRSLVVGNEHDRTAKDALATLLTRILQASSHASNHACAGAITFTGIQKRPLQRFRVASPAFLAQILPACGSVASFPYADPAGLRQLVQAIYTHQVHNTRELPVLLPAAVRLLLQAA